MFLGLVTDGRRFRDGISFSRGGSGVFSINIKRRAERASAG